MNISSNLNSKLSFGTTFTPRANDQIETELTNLGGRFKTVIGDNLETLEGDGKNYREIDYVPKSDKDFRTGYFLKLQNYGQLNRLSADVTQLCSEVIALAEAEIKHKEEKYN